MARRFLAVVGVALATAAPASAHAIPLGSEPPSGVTLPTAPSVVVVTFDSPIRVGPRNAAVRNDGTNVLAGKPTILTGNRIELPLQAGLGSGDYSVRWSIVSEDGHEEEGVIAFGVGTAGAPVAVLKTQGTTTWQRVIMRTLLFLGVLGAAGAAFFAVAVLGGALPRRQAHLLFVCFLFAFAGADALIHVTGAAGTRFEHLMIVAAVASGIGAATSALAPLEPRLRYLAYAAAAVLFVCPTFAGHALDPDQPAILAPAADLLHLAGAAVWLGGVASLALARTGTVQRFSQFALPAVGLVVLGGGARALTELSTVSQVWSTSYGRTLIVKTALFGLVLAIAWLARRGLLIVQLAVLAVLATTVGVLTNLRPGRAQASGATQSQSNVPIPPPEPPPGVFVEGAQAGKLAVGFAWARGRATLTLVGSDGSGASNEDVTIDDVEARSCGDGCYTGRSSRKPRVSVDGTPLQFDVPAKLVSAQAALARARHLYDSAPAVTIRESLSSQPGNRQVSVFHERAPDEFAFSIVSSTQKGDAGEQGIVIGKHRWSRIGSSAPWQRTPQGVTFVPRAYWGAEARNAYYVGRNTLTFYDPQIRAWYQLRLDASGRPRELMMVAEAHFMHHDYSFRSPPISPPR
ncbi:MAG TPA: copper resistance protein CopC [Gaiellaceae bacterium]